MISQVNPQALLNGSEIFANWEADFKNMFPYSGPIYISLDEDKINCFVKYQNITKHMVYLPFLYYIGDYKLGVYSIPY